MEEKDAMTKKSQKKAMRDSRHKAFHSTWPTIQSVLFDNKQVLEPQYHPRNTLYTELPLSSWPNRVAVCYTLPSIIIILIILIHAHSLYQVSGMTRADEERSSSN